MNTKRTKTPAAATNGTTFPGLVVWFTGLSGAGKTTISRGVKELLLRREIPTVWLDGDEMRKGLCSDLGFSEEDRRENSRRVAETARLFRQTGFVVLVSLITPYRDQRERARTRIGAKHFMEVYVKADRELCIRRDPKGLYRKAMRGEISRFTAVSDRYEEPVAPDLIIDTERLTQQEAICMAADAAIVRIGGDIG